MNVELENAIKEYKNYTGAMDFNDITKIFEKYKDDKFARYYLADCYLNGRGKTIDTKKGIMLHIENDKYKRSKLAIYRYYCKNIHQINNSKKVVSLFLRYKLYKDDNEKYYNFFKKGLKLSIINNYYNKEKYNDYIKILKKCINKIENKDLSNDIFNYINKIVAQLDLIEVKKKEERKKHLREVLVKLIYQKIEKIYENNDIIEMSKLIIKYNDYTQELVNYNKCYLFYLFNSIYLCKSEEIKNKLIDIIDKGISVESYYLNLFDFIKIDDLPNELFEKNIYYFLYYYPENRCSNDEQRKWSKIIKGFKDYLVNIIYDDVYSKVIWCIRKIDVNVNKKMLFYGL